MSKEAKQNEGRIDQFFSGPSARADRWRDLVDLAQAWVAGTESRLNFESALSELAATEEFHAYPGHHLLAALRDSASADDARSALSLVKRISTALITRSFRRHAGDWEAHEENGESVPDLLPPTLGRSDVHRPYFETLIVTGVAGRALAGALHRMARAPPPARCLHL